MKSFYLFCDKWLKSMQLLCLLSAITSVILSLTPMNRVMPLEYLAIFVAQGLLFSLVNLIPIKWLRNLLKWIVFFLPAGVYYFLYGFSLAAEWQEWTMLLIYAFLWFIHSSFAACDNRNQIERARDTYESNVAFFTVMTILLLSGYLILTAFLIFFSESGLSATFLSTWWYIPVFFLIELLLIFISRNACYRLYQDKKDFVFPVFEMVSGGIFATLIGATLAFREKLNVALVSLIAGGNWVMQEGANAIARLTRYHNRLLSAVGEGELPVMEPPPQNQDDLLDDFGLSPLPDNSDMPDGESFSEMLDALGGWGSLNNYLAQAGGAESIRELFDETGGIDETQELLSKYDADLGSIIDRISQEGGLEEFLASEEPESKELLEEIGGEEGLVDLLDRVGGEDGLKALAALKNLSDALGESGSFADLLASADGLETLEQMAQQSGFGSGLDESGKIKSEQESPNAVALVYTETSTQLFLRYKSYGDYTGSGWSEAKEYRGALTGDYSMNYLTGAALSASGYTSVDVKIHSLCNQYLIPDYPAMGIFSYDIQKSDVKQVGDTSVIYELYYYNVANIPYSLAEPTRYSRAEQEYRKFVYENYTALPDATKSYLNDFLKERKISGTGEKAVNAVLQVLKDYTYSRDYDRAMDSSSDIVRAFLAEYREGNCQHFASSAVAMYRALGLPARYVTGLASTTKSGEWTMFTADAAHAWVEIYRDGIGWVRIDATVGKGATNREDSSFNAEEFQQAQEEWKEQQNGGGSGGSSGSGSGSGSGGGSGGGSSSEGGGGSGSGSSSGSGGDSPDTDNSNEEKNPDEEENPDKEENPNEEENRDEEENPNEEKNPDEELTQEEEQPSSVLPLVIGIASGVVALAVIAVVAVILTKKIKKLLADKRRKKRIKEMMTEKSDTITQERYVDEEHRSCVQIIREQYAEFLMIADRDGIVVRPIDTTQSIKDRYSRNIGPNEAIEILTELYRIARYCPEEKLYPRDADQAVYCLSVIKKASVEHFKQLKKRSRHK